MALHERNMCYAILSEYLTYATENVKFFFIVKSLAMGSVDRQKFI